MNTSRTLITSLVAGAALVGGGVLATAQATTGGAPVTTSSSAGTVAVDSDVAAALRFAREEERMARDLYTTLADRYDGAAPFAMIARSEQQHFDAVGGLLDRYRIADPSRDARAGSYADPTLQRLYDQWLEQGRTSLSAAYDVGIALEQRDIADLEDTLATVDQPDVRRVLSALLNASRHHQAAFEAAADGELFGPMGPGYGMGMGQGNGMGPGNGMGQGRGPGAGDCPMLDTLTD
ncbi:MAG: DUF2202 domain-containing protein [Nocardioides sp.]|nr:DUF2202 domain-containing protein [Nocardioides sp.]